MAESGDIVSHLAQVAILNRAREPGRPRGRRMCGRRWAAECDRRLERCNGHPHRPLAQGQVHRPRRADQSPRLVGQCQCDGRRRFRPPARRHARLRRRPDALARDAECRCRSRRSASASMSSPRRRGTRSSSATCCARRCPERRCEATILHLPGFAADPARHGTRTGTVIALDLSRNIVLIAGTAYAGEIKKAVFSLINFHAPLRGIFPMHCSANIGPAATRRCSSASAAPARRR